MKFTMKLESESNKVNKQNVNTEYVKITGHTG